MVVELRDIRLPLSTAVPFLSTKFATKARVVFFTKADLVSKAYASKVLKWAKAQGMPAFIVQSQGNAKGLKRIFEQAAREYSKHQKTVLGITRIVIVGLPNVGKSTMINALKGKNVARAANSPGVTKGRQWIRLSEKVSLLDTPGVATLAKKQGRNDAQRLKLGLCRVLPDKDWDWDELALWLHTELVSRKLWRERDSESFVPLSLDFSETLHTISNRYRLIVAGGEPDFNRASQMLCEYVQKQFLTDLDLDGVTSR